MEIPEFDLMPLIGCELHTVLVGRNFLELNLLRPPHVVGGKFRDDGCRIDVEAGFVLVRTDSTAVDCCQRTMVDAVGVLAASLIDSAVEHAQFNQDSELTLLFANGCVLTLRVDATGFESYHIHTPRDSIIVSKTSNPSFQRTASPPLN